MKIKKLKKVFLILLAGSMTAVMFTGCGSEAATNEDGETVITFGIHVANPEEQEPVTNSIVQAFNEKYNGKYKVEFEAADTESHSKI